MVNLYHYLYFQLYMSSMKAWGRQKDQSFRTNISLAFFLSMNFLSILLILDYFNLSALERLPNMSRDSRVFAVIIFGTIQYFYFKYNNRYKKVLSEFNFEKEIQKSNYGYIGNAYCIASSIIFVFLGWFIFFTK